LGLDGLGFEGGGHSAQPFDLLETTPGRLGQVIGEAFHVVRATGRVDDPHQV
jgi:hypothetical protein